MTTNKPLHALIIDDHPLISEAYKSAFHYVSKKNPTFSFHIEIANNCDTGRDCIQEYASSDNSLAIVFLDISLPPSADGKILSGEDLGLKIKELLPETKIIVSTTFNDNYRIHNIFKHLNPDGFLIKNDITPLELVEAIQEVLTDPPYYSKTVTKLLRSQISNDLLVDKIDRKILYELSIGTRLKDLPEIIHLSLAAIKKRKSQLEEIFDARGDDRQLVLNAREKGFI